MFDRRRIFLFGSLCHFALLGLEYFLSYLQSCAWCIVPSFMFSTLQNTRNTTLAHNEQALSSNQRSLGKSPTICSQGPELPGRSISIILLQPMVKGHLQYFECFSLFHRCPVITFVAYNLVFPTTSSSPCANHDQQFFTSTRGSFISLHHPLPHQRPHYSTARGLGQATEPLG